MSLKTYRAKRRFAKTPEPSGRESVETGGRSFVVQKHAASRLHYDFRLEHDGVLLSWAVPKGPSLDPGQKRLAVRVEDHPLAYGSFEGEIPKGQYGAGSVLLWDRGRWEPSGDVDEGLRRGKLSFELFGRKLHGRFALITLRDRKNWLLLKEHDAEERPSSQDVLSLRPESVAPAKKGRARIWSSRPKTPARARRRSALDPSRLEGARRAPLPDFISPQLCALVQAPPQGQDWLHEIKFDGYRLIARLEKGQSRLFTRRANDWSAHFPAIKKALEALPLSTAWLDGEAVALDKRGRSSFQALQNALGDSTQANVVYYAFDLLYLDGYDLRGCSLLERKRALAALFRRRGDPLRYADQERGHGPEFFKQACRAELEGIVSKRAASTYASARTSSWLKIKCLKRQEFVIAGFTDPRGSRSGFGALLLGVHEGKRLRYVGKVGTGFDEKTLASLLAKLEPLRVDRPAFADPPRGYEAKGAHWTAPELVAEVAFSEWTSDGHVRHPSFIGLRADKPAVEVTAERASSPAAAPTLTNPDRVIYPEMALTKLDLAHYYESVASSVLPFLARRPLALVRCPSGFGGECFYQKHVGDTFPESVKGVDITEKSVRRTYSYIDDRHGLSGLVQMGVLEMHPWGSRIEALEKPDVMTFDLDPAPDVAWKDVVAAARHLREKLEAIGLRSYVKTTGGKGLHVVVRVLPELEWEPFKAFAKTVAESLVKDDPRRYIATMAKAARRGKIFVDYLRNARGATAVAAYSTRAKSGATVSTPLSWQELSAELDPSSLNVKTIPKRLARLKTDPWRGYQDDKQSLRRLLKL